MQMTKLGAVLASLAITTGGAALVATAPAQAGTPVTTPTTAHLSFTDPSTGNQYTGWRALYGTRVATLTTDLTDGTAAPTNGSAILQRRLPGGVWRDQRTDSDVSDGVTFASPKALGNAFYRVQYSGGDDLGTGGSTTWAPSTSNPVQVLTYWNFHERVKFVGQKGLMYGVLSPHVKNHRILIQVKHGSWKRYKVVHTTRRSHWRAVVAPGHNRYTLYRAVVAGTKHLQKSQALAKFKLTYNRTQAPTSSARLISLR